MLMCNILQNRTPEGSDGQSPRFKFAELIADSKRSSKHVGTSFLSGNSERFIMNSLADSCNPDLMTGLYSHDVYWLVLPFET